MYSFMPYQSHCPKQFSLFEKLSTTSKAETRHLELFSKYLFLSILWDRTRGSILIIYVVENMSGVVALYLPIRDVFWPPVHVLKPWHLPTYLNTRSSCRRQPKHYRKCHVRDSEILCKSSGREQRNTMEKLLSGPGIWLPIWLVMSLLAMLLAMLLVMLLME